MTTVVGHDAPDFFVHSLDGSAIWLRGLRGRAVLLHFLPDAARAADFVRNFSENVRALASDGARALPSGSTPQIVVTCPRFEDGYDGLDASPDALLGCDA